MKTKLISLIGILLLFSLAGKAQNPNDSIKKKKEEVIFLVGMHCQACKEKIENNISLEKGVKDITVNLEKKEVIITFNPLKTNTEKLKQAIIDLGYTCQKK